MTSWYEEPEAMVFMDRIHEVLDIVSNDKPIKTEYLVNMFPEYFQEYIVSTRSPIPLEELYGHMGSIESLEKTQALVENPEVTYTIADPENKRVNKQRFLSTQALDKPRGKKTPTFTTEDTFDPRFNEDEFYSVEESHRRQTYVMMEIKRIYRENEETIGKYSEKLGSVSAAMKLIRIKDRNEAEQKVLDDIAYLDRLTREQDAYEKAAVAYFATHCFYPFPMPQWLQDEFRQAIDDKVNECKNINWLDAMGIPDNSEQVMLERRLREQKALDLAALESKALADAHAKYSEVNTDDLVRRDLNNKDEDLIRKMNILSDVIEVNKMPEIVADLSESFDPEILKTKIRKMHSAGFVTSEFFTENVIKMVYLNNCDPQTYNFELWAEYHNMSPDVLRNALIHINIPVIEEDKVVGRITYKDIPKPKTVTDLNEENMRRFIERQRKQADAQTRSSLS